MVQNAGRSQKVLTKRTNSRPCPEPALDVPTAAISDAAVRSLIDECIAPALVEKFLKEKCPRGRPEES
jgi:hypothetical protein